MTTDPTRLAAALADRYAIERELGQGGMATVIAGEQAQVADAITFYTRLVALWKDCDPALIPRRNEIRRRRDALLASQG